MPRLPCRQYLDDCPRDNHLVSPTLTCPGGERTTLGRVLTNAGVSANDRVQLARGFNWRIVNFLLCLSHQIDAESESAM